MSKKKGLIVLWGKKKVLSMGQLKKKLASLAK